MSAEVKNVKVSDLTQDRRHGNDWCKAKEDRIQELADDMETRGFDEQEPIIVSGSKVVDGRHRVLAAKRAGIEEVPAIIPTNDQMHSIRQAKSFSEACLKVRQSAGYDQDIETGWCAMPIACQKRDQIEDRRR